jgi:hypothetical protein
LHKAAPAGIFAAAFSESLPLIATHKPPPRTSRGSAILRPSTRYSSQDPFVIQRQNEEAKKKKMGVSGFAVDWYGEQGLAKMQGNTASSGE